MVSFAPFWLSLPALSDIIAIQQAIFDVLRAGTLEGGQQKALVPVGSFCRRFFIPRVVFLVHPVYADNTCYSSLSSAI
jgi:hypothetical protein